MNVYNVIVDDLLEGSMKSEMEPEVGDWATVRYYNDVGDVKWAEGVITDVLGDEND